jgi:hypothetical protein
MIFLLPFLALYEVGSIMYLRHPALGVQESIAAYGILDEFFKAAHDRNDDDEDADAESDASDGDQGDDGNEGAFGPEIAQGDEPTEFHGRDYGWSGGAASASPVGLCRDGQRGRL